MPQPHPVIPPTLPFPPRCPRQAGEVDDEALQDSGNGTQGPDGAREEDPAPPQQQQKQQQQQQQHQQQQQQEGGGEEEEEEEGGWEGLGSGALPPLPAECCADKHPVVVLRNVYTRGESEADPNFFDDLEVRRFFRGGTGALHFCAQKRLHRGRVGGQP